MVRTIFTVAAISMFVILFGFIAIAPTNAFADIEFEEKEFTQQEMVVPMAQVAEHHFHHQLPGFTQTHVH